MELKCNIRSREIKAQGKVKDTSFYWYILLKITRVCLNILLEKYIKYKI